MHARLLIMAALFALVAVLYMVYDAKAPWSFLLPFRGTKLAALILVAVAVSTATVLFQTVTQNRILTPSIMGFDALYVLILTSAVYFLGAMTFAGFSDQLILAVNVVLMIVASLALFGTLLTQVRADLLRMILTGIIFGTLFRSVTGFMQRMIDPNEFSIIQIASYARFTQIGTDLLMISAMVTAVALIWVWRIRHRLDVLALGYDASINLGENPRRGQIESLVLIAVLVSVSTALVGPVAFLGLLVVSIARLITPTERHDILLISSGLIAALVLVGGQTLMERIFALATPLTVIIDLFGGAVFLVLLLKGTRQ